jgi:hypothetical protein
MRKAEADRFPDNPDHDRLPRYRNCGIHAFYVLRSDPDKFSVNVRCLDDVDLTKIRPKAFDGKHWEEAIRHYVR